MRLDRVRLPDVVERDASHAQGLGRPGLGRGVAWDLPPGASTVRGRLRNVRRLAIVTTHGSARQINWLEGQAGRGTVFRSLRVLCHPLVRTTWLALYRMDHIDDSVRARFLDKVERRFLRW
ncbi:MAG: hypothetical protein WKF58_06045 [Ilumatobacteraceae bacterium]